MKRKFVDVRVSRNGEIVDALCVNECSMEKLMAILTLVEAGDEVLVIMKEQDLQASIMPNMSNQ